jgi:MoxR-like ATPase
MDDKNYRSQPVIGLDDVPAVQEVARNVHMDRALIYYASELVG